ncbi:L-serine ammonia-lyase, iron-sulfur-dependent, subunit alpha [Endozoicomonas sp. Mp262]|uniref:L-cysteine desulfidase family protein n=1 Tax=Endozoicomonas sp. Mp262 TaxID=2919499 RepID=UPI0021D867C8
MKPQWSQYIKIINSVVKPALGCTEPISAALASALAVETLGAPPEKLTVRVSENLYKNAMGVFVPGTGRKGLYIAAAAGAVAGEPGKGLEVLKNITEDDVIKAQRLIDEGRVEVNAVASDVFIYCQAIAEAQGNSARVEISGGHTRVVSKALNGKTVFSLDPCDSCAGSTECVCDGVDISIKGIYEFATEVDARAILFMNQAAELNCALSREGMSNEYGLQVGRTMKEHMGQGVLGEDLCNRIVMHTSAASDARMGGAPLPAMSNYGSGNQGIAATVPVVEMARFRQVSEDVQARALAMSHLMAIYIKSHYPPLSAFCGNSVTSAASAFAMTYLSGGSFEQCCHAMQNVMSDCSGMVCDGAKSSCAMKVATSSGVAIRSCLMALNGSAVNQQGIIAGDVENTIKNVGQMISSGMSSTDETIINIMRA